MAASALEALADWAGIQPGFVDEWGIERRPERATLKALLAAMGLPAEDDRAAAASLQEARRRQWERPLPPAVVVQPKAGSPPAVPVRLPAGDSGAVSWQITSEQGETERGSASMDSLPAGAQETIAGARFEQRLLPLPASLAPGYYRFRLERAQAPELSETLLAVAPPKAWVPSGWQRGERSWGIAVQAYGLRSVRNWGMGDFTDLQQLADMAASHGGDALGINPLHALFATQPERASPYAGSSRFFLNPLYLDLEALPEFSACEEARRLVGESGFQARLRMLRQSELVDYPAVSACKLPVLELLFRQFRAQDLGPEETSSSHRGRDFLRFLEEGGEALHRHALFEALQETLQASQGDAKEWRHWPEEYRHPRSGAVARFARENRDRVLFHAWLQWSADNQLASTAQRCAGLGMDVGLYRDLAVGVAADGGESWAAQEDLALGVLVGAPPDRWIPTGQNWGLPPFNPMALEERAFASWIGLLRANMRHAGALRIDHVLGLMRQYWIPEGASPREGAYVRFPFEQLLGLVCLESQRQRCVVVGEDLGTVPEGLRERMQETDLLAYRPLYFQHDSDGGFLPPEAYPELAVVTVTTHDLPTLPGYWSDHDLGLRSRLGLFPTDEMERDAFLTRVRDRRALLAALRRAGLLPERLEDDGAELPELTEAMVRAVYRLVARTPSRLLLVHLEDLLDERDQPNVPGTWDEHPNWRRRLPLSLEELAEDPRLYRLAAAVRDERSPPR